jgi:tetratricopeptide (TPR) repeat protein/DNA-binding CsgD family transcriptional regulator
MSGTISARQNQTNIDSLLEIVKSGDANENTFLQVTTYYFSQSNYEKALEYSEKGIKLSDNNESVIKGELLLIHAYINVNWGLSQKALIDFTEVKQIGLKTRNSKLIFGGFHGLGRAYINLGMNNKAIDELTKGLDYSNDSTEKRIIGIMNNALGLAYSNIGNNEKALYHIKIFEKISRDISDTIATMYAFINEGKIYKSENNYTKAFEKFRIAEEINCNMNNDQASVVLFGNYAELLYEQKQYKKAIEQLRKGIIICNKNRMSKAQKDNYKLMIDNYLKLDEKDSAINYYNKLIALKDSVYENDKTNIIKYIKAQQTIQQRIKESEILAQKLYNRNLLLSLSSGMIILILILIYVLYSRYQLKTNIHNEEKKELSQNLDEKNRELVGKLLSENQKLVARNKLVKHLDDYIENTTSKEVAIALETTKSELIKNNPTAFSWDNFKVYFEQVHPDFFQKLTNPNYRLTINELRHCSYMKMNLSTKEIASLLNVSDRAVQMARYRIKKKLGLTADQDLIAYILGL